MQRIDETALMLTKGVRLAKLHREKGRYDLAEKELRKLLSNTSRDNLSLYNMVLNELEINQGRRVLDSKPRGLAITLTSRCNLRCIMCGVWKESWDIPYNTVKEIIGLLPYLERIFWQGGEVFLSPYFEELFERIVSYPNIRQDINTNGLFIDRHWAKKLAGACANIIFSIDGISRETYEYVRKGARFEDLLKSIEMFNAYRQSNSGRGSSTIINLVVMRSNYRELEGFIDFAKRYRFDRLQLTPVDIDSQENIFLHRDTEALGYIERVMPQILKKAKDYGIEISNWLPGGGYSRSYQQGVGLFQAGQKSEAPPGNPNPDNNKLSCYWPWQFLFIDCQGQVRPQCFCIRQVGNVCDNTIEEIWNNDLMQSYRRRLYENDYRNWCDYRCISGKISREALSLD
jgi:MoaA/NifB/PqqE/SkfB family radical SAM enzyme